LKDETNYLFLTYPNNPCGTSLSREKLKQIADICRKYNCYVVADEIYSE
jgi:aspartate aminotransferase